MMDSLSVFMPTKDNHDTFFLSLLSAIQKVEPDSIHILDSGDKPVCSSPLFSHCIGIAEDNGIEVFYTYNRISLSLAREEVISCKGDLILQLDSDIVIQDFPSRDTIESAFLKYGVFLAPFVVSPVNLEGYEDYDTRKYFFPSIEFEAKFKSTAIWYRQFINAHTNFSNNLKYSSVPFSGTFGLLARKVDLAELYTTLEIQDINVKAILPREDMLITRGLCILRGKYGVLSPQYRVYHLGSSRSLWNRMTDEVIQENFIACSNWEELKLLAHHLEG